MRGLPPNLDSNPWHRALLTADCRLRLSMWLNLETSKVHWSNFRGLHFILGGQDPAVPLCRVVLLSAQPDGRAGGGPAAGQGRCSSNDADGQRQPCRQCHLGTEGEERCAVLDVIAPQLGGLAPRIRAQSPAAGKAGGCRPRCVECWDAAAALAALGKNRCSSWQSHKPL